MKDWRATTRVFYGWWVRAAPFFVLVFTGGGGFEDDLRLGDSRAPGTAHNLLEADGRGQALVACGVEMEAVAAIVLCGDDVRI